jgi:tRNA-Thr(GGU) m(6)t(6)A37 methyltransferase TsaA
MTEQHSLTCLNISPIGFIRSPYREKFGIPRQPGIVRSARFYIEFLDDYYREEAFRGLDEFSHIWVIFVFSANIKDGWKPTVRPPRQGGNTRTGVFATRSPFRPNPVGISAVRNEGWKDNGWKKSLVVSGGDFLDMTPVIDIKPYVPYTDSIQDATGGFAHYAPESCIEVLFSSEAEEKCRQISWDGYGTIQQFIKEVLSQDPRPAYHSSGKIKQDYAMKLCGFDIIWKVENGCITVTDIIKC